FITWHDIIDGRPASGGINVLLQFDIDGGPRSMAKLYRELKARGVRATVMAHRRGHHWYPYETDALDLEWLADAEQHGWAIGYHNNALSQIAGATIDGIYAESSL